ncbi:MAG: SDR family oxidoreductase [Deltaproteobacteria bacterium]|nr:SDR family oxidoreductase [Deltaproteobacteria bacterium]
MNGSWSLVNKVALVTGASRGLGRAMALALGEAGAKVAITDLLVEGRAYDPDRLGEYGRLGSHFAGNDGIKTLATADEIIAPGAPSCAMKMDVAEPEEIHRVVLAITKTLGPIDILINNAAVMDNLGPLEEQTHERWERDLKVNLSGAFHCIKAVWPGMVKRGGGRIINISSVAGLMGAWLQPAYGSAKAGLLGLTKSLAIEGGRHNITVNAVCPGFIATEAVKLLDQNLLERIRKRTALGRLGTVEEVAQVVLFLASDAAAYITGAAIPVTGGSDLFIF